MYMYKQIYMFILNKKRIVIIKIKNEGYEMQ